MLDKAEKADARDDRSAEFFLAIDAALLGSGSLFRIYPDGDTLLFLRVGTFYGPIGVEVGRTVHGGNWLGSIASAAKPFLSGAVLVGGILLIILLRFLLRGTLPPGGATDVVLVFALLGLCFGVLALWVIAGSVKRAAALDAMTAEERRAEVARDRRNLTLKADEIAEASIDKAAGGWGTDEAVPANLTLTLRSKKKQKLRFQHRRDVKAAVRAIKRMIGKENVTVNVPLTS